ncbi:MAG: hypothetical protein IH931_07375 [candidate division Zixibacteria bacterium]|nr:hypothetical protein [candidate division Zixibacteria bacterium]
MNKSKSNAFPVDRIKLLIGVLLAVCFLLGSPAHALTDYIFFSVNGDTTSPALTQGDTLSFGANCDTGSTVVFEIWYDANSNSVIDASTDVLLEVFSMTDGLAGELGDSNPIPDGFVQTIGAIFGLHPGPYIFEGTNLSDGTSATRVLVNSVMISPPNQVKGQIFVPGHPAPDSAFLSNVWIFGEAESDDGGFYAALTDNSGLYEINIEATSTGDTFFVEPSNIPGFVTPSEQSTIASGVVSNINFNYEIPADSVYGFVKDDVGAIIDKVGFVFCFEQSFASNKEVRTVSGRYAINFSATELGEWSLGVPYEDFVPDYVIPYFFNFSHDTLNSFQYDIVLPRADTTIFVKVTESGSLPVNQYEIEVSSENLNAFTRSVSGTGSNNVVTFYISSADDTGWSVFLNDFSEDYPIPPGLVIGGVQPTGLSPGDTALINLIAGKLVSDTIVQDPEDPPIDWNTVFVGLFNEQGNFNGSTDPNGVYSVYSDTGTYFLSAFATGYLTNPSGRNVEVTGDTTGGLGFIINETHARVTGTLVNVPTPLSSSELYIYAHTDSGIGPDGYYASAVVDSLTGTYQLDLCEGLWTITPPDVFVGWAPPIAPILTIGEVPDTARTVDLTYTSVACCIGIRGDYNGDGMTDLVLYDGEIGETQLWLMDGSTVTASELLPSPPLLDSWDFATVDLRPPGSR